MKKNYLGIVIIVFVVLLAVAFVVVVSSSKSTSETNNEGGGLAAGEIVGGPNESGPPVVETVDIVADSSVSSIKTKIEGTFVPIASLTADIDSEKISDGLYSIGYDETNANNFEIFYHTESGAITVTLTAEPLATYRLLAEEVLAEELRMIDGDPLTAKEMCALDILVVTNRYVSERYAGVNLGLSFCPGSVDL